MFAMSGDGKDDVKIPVVFLFTKEANKLKDALKINKDLEVSLHGANFERKFMLSILELIFQQFLIKIFFLLACS